ncbi:MAG: nucleotide sugar dehydrogenase [Bacteroidota bacterium]|nr:nucleotide sugar dehydrogenase [Bacteroidota bacterium]MDW8137580.1 nucleotide sugar dehydrogenase [Bacteroidota bacterium]
MHPLEEAILQRRARVGVIGLGYVGLPLARVFYRRGFSVIGFDIDPDKVAQLRFGRSYIRHIPSEWVAEAVGSGRFEPTDAPERLPEADVLLICVPTPLGPHQEPDLRFVRQTAETIALYLRPGQLVVLESTTYPGTTEEELLPILSRSGLQVGRDFFLGYSPEREDPGNARYTTEQIPKITSGVTNLCAHLVDVLYRSVVAQTVSVSSPRVAEAAKLLENIYRAVNIALVNELKLVLDRMGIDIWEVIEAASTKPFGFQPFYPGPGLGGHCIPIDPFYLTWKARAYGVHTRFIELAGEINTAMPDFVVSKLIRALNEQGKAVRGSRLLLIGVAYKPDVDDLRESPALVIMDRLEELEAQVDYHDPYVPVLPPTRKFRFNKASVPLEAELLRRYDAVLIITHHSGIDYELIAQEAALILDTRNALRVRGLRVGRIWKA